MKRELSYLLLLLTAIPMAYADSGASDPCSGPEVTIDGLEANMPPIYDQHRAEWCTTFAAKTLLDYNIHTTCATENPKDACGYTPEHMLSASDLQANNAFEDESVRGKYIDLFSAGSDFTDVLEGAQKYGSLTDAQLPLDQALFVGPGTPGGALIERLSAYYDQLPPSQATANGECPPEDSFADLRAKYPDVSRISEAVQAQAGNSPAGKSEFMKKLAESYYPIPQALQQARAPIHPAFNITNFETTDPVKLKAHVVDSLKQSPAQPVALPLCIYKIIRGANIPDETNPKESCGDHGMVVVGFKKTGSGECQVRLRNTWGEHWPERSNDGKGGDGTVWVDFNLVVNSINRGTDTATGGPGPLRAISISPRASDAPIRNELFEDGSHLLGETWHHQFTKPYDGERELRSSQGLTILERGSFDSRGILVQGTRIAPDGNQVWGKFNGTAPMPSCGAVKIPGRGIFCVLNGAATTHVSSAQKCKCVQ